MNVHKAAVVLSVLLLTLLAVALAEASLVSLLFIFSAILRLYLSIGLGPEIFQASFPWSTPPELQVMILPAGTVASFLVMLAGGTIAAVWRYRRWQPST